MSQSASELSAKALSVLESPQFKSLVQKKWQISLVLAAVMLFFYFGLIVLIAVNKPFLATLVVPDALVTLGIPLGFFVVVLAIVITGIYTYWANSYYDKQVKEIMQNMK